MRRVLVPLAAVALACLVPPATATATKGVEVLPLPVPIQEESVLAPGPEGDVWFTALGVPAVGRITPQGEATAFPMPFPSPETGPSLTAGPDGAVWMTANGGKGNPDYNRIVRVDTAGAIAEFHTPTLKSRPTGIVTGPDGALWFSESNAGRIGRLTPQGDFTEYPLPGPGGTPGPIAVSDGLLWAIDSDTSLLLVSTAGEMRELALPPAREGPRGIVAAPGGGVWIAEFGRHAIARVGLAGSFVERRLPRAVSGDPEGAIGVDRGGDVWFLASYGLVMRMTPAGRFTEFVLQGRRRNCDNLPCAPALRARDLTIGPDGKVWVLASGHRSEGAMMRIDPASPPPVPTARIRPEITGRARVGVRLVADLGSWARHPTEYSVGWRICDRSGRECRSLPGQGQTQVLDRDAVGKRLIAEVGATNASGTTFLTTQPSPVVEPPAAALRVGLGADRARVDARGRALVPLACAGGAPGTLCSGQVSLRPAAGRGSWGSTHYRLASGRHRTIAVPLAAGAVTALAAHGHFAARVHVTLWGGKATGGMLRISRG